jgi:hypothetical protein
MSTSTKKTLRVPLAADGVPLVVEPQQQDKTREIRDGSPVVPSEQTRKAIEKSAPRDIVEDDITVPVHSSIESSLTFEVLRRQSTSDDNDDGGNGKP